MSAEGTTPAMHLASAGMASGRGRMSSGSYKNRVGARPRPSPLPPLRPLQPLRHIRCTSAAHATAVHLCAAEAESSRRHGMD